ncbi:hypothetical protein GP486_004869 [Trichoglossum hirsutum]|uniref:Peptidase C14 caspase domain-containing protein n=1 Tax=Trichoglossum hirsutum TaxID=265104 RepID=A0A9P8LA99_9PEZI|nr:hypothetical protein GP486_004869 [Trichoglossum hirsutum]
MARPDCRGRRTLIPHHQAKFVFNKTLAGYGQQGGGEYKNVNALFITWKDDDLKCLEKEVLRLQSLFRDKFNYCTRSYQIPSQKSKTSLQLELATFVNQNDSPENLVIVYYGGHGIAGEESEGLELAAKGDGDGDPKVLFNHILSTLRIIDCDVLIILDCCHAGMAFYPEQPGTRKFELLTAASCDDWVPGPEKAGSFTTVMVNEIEELLKKQSSGFTVSTLYHKLYHSRELKTKPLLFDMSQRDYGKLWLRPRPEDPDRQPQKDLTSLKLTLHIADQVNDLAIHDIARGLQYLKYVQKITFDELYAPDDVILELVRSVRMATIIRNWRKAFLGRKRRVAEAAKSREVPEDNEAAQMKIKVVERRDSSYYDWTSSDYIVNGERKRVKGRPPSQESSNTVKNQDDVSFTYHVLLGLAYSIYVLLSMGLTVIIYRSVGRLHLAYDKGGHAKPRPEDMVVEGHVAPGGGGSSSSISINGHSGMAYPGRSNNSNSIMNGDVFHEVIMTGS